MEEIWKNIEGWPGYQVSNTGYIRSIKGPTPRILSNNNGQCIVSDNGNSKMLSIKLEVAKAFLDYVGGGSGVRLKDGNKQNCSVDNLIVKESLYISGEEWRDIPGYDGRYQISSMKRVKSVVRGSGKLLRIKGGCVSLSLDGYMRDLSVNKIYQSVFSSDAVSNKKTKSLFGVSCND